MCIDPFTLAAIGAGVSAAGSVASGVAGYQSSKAQAEYADRQATMERQKGAYEASRLRDRNNRELAGMRGQYLSSGIALSGSAADVLQDSATEASLDEQAIKYGAKVRSDNLMFESGLARSNANMSMVGGILGGVGALASGFSEASKFRQSRTMIRNPYEG